MAFPAGPPAAAPPTHGDTRTAFFGKMYGGEARATDSLGRGASRARDIFGQPHLDGREIKVVLRELQDDRGPQTTFGRIARSTRLKNFENGEMLGAT